MNLLKADERSRCELLSFCDGSLKSHSVKINSPNRSLTFSLKNSD